VTALYDLVNTVDQVRTKEQKGDRCDLKSIPYWSMTSSLHTCTCIPTVKFQLHISRECQANELTEYRHTMTGELSQQLIILFLHYGKNWWSITFINTSMHWWKYITVNKVIPW